MNTIKTPRFHGFTFIYVAAASAFLVVMAMDMVGIGRTVLKAIPVKDLWAGFKGMTEGKQC